MGRCADACPSHLSDAVADAAVAAAVQRLREEEEDDDERRINKRDLVLHAALALPHPSLTNSVSVCLYGTDCA